MATRPDMQKAIDHYILNFKVDSKPCKKISFNCAARLSLALNAGGYTISDAKDPSRVHNSEKNHIHKWDKGDNEVSTVPHFVGAEDMYKHLQQSFSFRRLRSTKGSSIRQQIAQQKGILFFENCFKRYKKDKTKKGDHIDIWNGVNYGNEMIGTDAAGRTGRGEDLFSKASKVFFLPI